MSISTSLHATMLIFVAVVSAVVIIIGHFSVKNKTLKTTSRMLSFVIISIWFIYNIYYFHPRIFKWELSLPIQVCDFLSPIASIILVLPSFRFGRSVLFLSAIPLAGQAVLTPTGDQDPTTYRFWLFWTLHASIIAISLFDVIVRRFLPKFKDFALVLLFDLGYIVLILPLNIKFDWNYGYIGNALPEGDTLIGLLGSWPDRILFIFLLVIGAQGIMLTIGMLLLKVKPTFTQ